MITHLDRKVIRTTITLVGDEFEDGSNQIVAEGLRTLCTVQFGGGAVMPHADISIYGLNMDAMLKLTRIRWRDIQSLQNIVRVEAGDEGGDLTEVYEGNITFGYIDMSNAPDVAFRIRSTTAALNLFTPSTPITFEGDVPVVQAIEQLASSMGYVFENNGVPESLTMTDVTLVDTDINKIRSLCRAYQIDLYIEQRTIAIAPQGAPRQLRIPVISPRSGMLGYPTPTMQGIDVRCLYDPLVRFGGLVRVADSIIETCNGDWRVFGVTVSLESEIPGGNWHMDIKATHNEPNNAAISR